MQQVRVTPNPVLWWLLERMDKEQNVTRKITHTGRWHTKLLRNTEKRY